MIVHASPTESWVLLVAASDRPMPGPEADQRRDDDGAIAVDLEHDVRRDPQPDPVERRPQHQAPAPLVAAGDGVLLLEHDVVTHAGDGRRPGRVWIGAGGAHVVETVAAAGTQHAFRARDRRPTARSPAEGAALSQPAARWSGRRSPSVAAWRVGTVGRARAPGAHRPRRHARARAPPGPRLSRRGTRSCGAHSWLHDTGNAGGNARRRRASGVRGALGVSGTISRH